MGDLMDDYLVCFEAKHKVSHFSQQKLIAILHVKSIEEFRLTLD